MAGTATNPRTRVAIGAGLVAALCVVAGLFVARASPIYTVGLPVLVIATVAAFRWNRGVLIGILVLLLLHGIPFVSTPLIGASSEQSTGSLNNLIFLALMVALIASALGSVRSQQQRNLTRLASLWGTGYILWWLYKVLVGSPGIPIVHAMQYGREFMGFSLFLPLAIAALSRRAFLVGFAVTLAVGAAVYASGQILTQVGHAQLTWLIHVEKVTELEGVTRIYAPMDELLLAVFPMALATALLAPRPWRYLASLLAGLTGLALALSFTRAIYACEIIALVAISIVWLKAADWQSRRIRRTFAALLSVAILATVVVGGDSETNNSSPSPIQTIALRASSGLGNVEGSTGTFGYRLHEAHLELEILGTHWLGGLGFLNPIDHFVPSLRQGSIRDDDLGSLAIVMTMGLVGLIIAYVPLVFALTHLLRRRYSVVQYGGCMYLCAALVGSITLDTLASLPGLLVLGSALAFCLNWTALESPDARRVSLIDDNQAQPRRAPLPTRPAPLQPTAA